VPERLVVVGCEPLKRMSGDTTEELDGELSKPVHASLDEAATLVESLLGELIESVEQGQREVESP
jgi:hypothetical protein